MARKVYTTEQVIGILREIEVRLAQGEKADPMCLSLSISQQRYYRWRRAYGGLKFDHAKRLKGREREPPSERPSRA